MKMHSRWLGDGLARVRSGVGLGAECVVEKYVEVIPSLCMLYDSAPEPHLLDFSPLEFARQITLCTSELFRKIRLIEFLKSTSKASKGEWEHQQGQRLQRQPERLPLGAAPAGA